MTATHISMHIVAPPSRVYRALLDPRSIAQWRVPTGMRSTVHEFAARPGGAFRVSLTYDEPTARGKSSAHTDTYHGHFEELVPNERVVEVLEFETAEPSLMGTMRIITTLSPTPDGTRLEAIHEGLPPGLSPEANEAGWRDSLSRLAALLDDPEPAP